MVTSTYRPRNAGHDYYGRGTYLITLVVSGREPLLSQFSDKGRDALKGGDILTLTPLGEVVEQTWLLKSVLSMVRQGYWLATEKTGRLLGWLVFFS